MNSPYVVTTFDVDVGGNKTVVNAYLADLTAGGPVVHALQDKSVSGRYDLEPNYLGIGSLYNYNEDTEVGEPQYASGATLDEVALYGGILSYEEVVQHHAELIKEGPELWYREIFPSDQKANEPIDTEGWYCHYSSGAVQSLAPVCQQSATAFGEVLADVNSFPVQTGVVNGYFNNHSGATADNYLYWTDEMTNKVEFCWLDTLQVDTRFNTAQYVRLAVRLDVNRTAGDTSDDVWYVTGDFDKPEGSSRMWVSNGDANNRWWRHTFDVYQAEWSILDFVPGEVMELGAVKAVPPERAVITGFGLFHDSFVNAQNARFDNFALYVREIVPPSGTVMLVK